MLRFEDYRVLKIVSRTGLNIIIEREKWDKQQSLQVKAQINFSNEHVALY